MSPHQDVVFCWSCHLICACTVTRLVSDKDVDWSIHEHAKDLFLATIFVFKDTFAAFEELGGFDLWDDNDVDVTDHVFALADGAYDSDDFAQGPKGL